MMGWTKEPWTNDNGLVNGRESRKRFAPGVSIDIFDAEDWPEELHVEAQATAERMVTCINACAGLSNEEVVRIPLLLKALDGESDINENACPNAAMRFLSIIKDADSAWMEKLAQERAAGNAYDEARLLLRDSSDALDHVRYSCVIEQEVYAEIESLISKIGKFLKEKPDHE